MLDLNLDIITLISLLGFFQGMILGVLLLFLNKQKNKSIFYISLFVICYALGCLINALRGENDSTNIRVTFILNTIDFSVFLFPLFYYYVRQVSVFNNVKNNRLLYFPIVVIVLPLLMAISLPESLLNSTVVETIPMAIEMLVIGYGIFIGIYTVRLIIKHKKEILNQFASLQHKELKWALVYVLIGIVFECIMIFLSFLDYDKGYDLVMTIINVLLLYWISIRAILQQKVVSVLDKQQNNSKEAIGQEHNEDELKHDLQALVNELEEKIKKTEIFKQHNLSIIEIADLVSVHPRKVSVAINTITDQNFNIYINTFRIEKAKEILLSEASNKLSIEGVGNEVGFQSKSAFYAAFKKLVGETPTKFKASKKNTTIT